MSQLSHGASTSHLHPSRSAVTCYVAPAGQQASPGPGWVWCPSSPWAGMQPAPGSRTSRPPSYVLCVQGSNLPLDLYDAEEPAITEHQHLPDTEALAEDFKACLQVRACHPSAVHTAMWIHLGCNAACCTCAHPCLQNDPTTTSSSREVPKLPCVCSRHGFNCTPSYAVLTALGLWDAAPAVQKSLA